MTGGRFAKGGRLWNPLCLYQIPPGLSVITVENRE